MYNVNVNVMFIVYHVHVRTFDTLLNTDSSFLQIRTHYFTYLWFYENVNLDEVRRSTSLLSQAREVPSD